MGCVVPFVRARKRSPREDVAPIAIVAEGSAARMAR